MTTKSDLARFIEAQAPVYAAVRDELRAGRKQTHWMWFIFPQLRGLGRSETAQFFGIASAAEAIEYVEHPLLGGRLRECVGLVLDVQGRSAPEIFGSPDDMKFRSCLTSFAAVGPGESLFQRAMDKYFGGAPDRQTLARL